MADTVPIGVRVPAELAARVDARGKRTEVVIAALERYLSDAPGDNAPSAAPAPLAATETLHFTDSTVAMIESIVMDVLARQSHQPVANKPAPTNPLDIPGVFRASDIFRAPEPEPEPERKPCAYREYDDQAGEWYGCSLPEHGPKVKHKRGPAVNAPPSR